MEDLWSFSKESLQTECSIVNNILKEQADLLTKKTDGILVGKIVNRKLQDRKKGYEFVTLFQVVVPNLDDYAVTLFQVYSSVSSNFPVCVSDHGISKHSLDLSNCKKGIYNEDRIMNENEFKKRLKEILGSESVNERIHVLYAKASI